MAAKTTDPIDILLEMGIDLDNLSEEEDYLSALKEAIAKIQFQTKGAGDERQRILQEEVIKVRKSRKAADPKFKAKTTKVSPDAFFKKKKPEEQAQPVPGQKALPGTGSSAIVKRAPNKTAIAPFTPAKEDPAKKDTKELKGEDTLKQILGGVNSILRTLQSQNKFTKKQAEKDRRSAEKRKRGAQEDKLEAAPMKKFFEGAKKIAKPALGFFESIFEFIKNILIGRLLVKIIEWMGNPENEKKLKAIIDFFKVTWPAFLAVFLAFKLGLGGFIGNLIGLVARSTFRLLGLIPKMLKGLKTLAMGNPMATAAVAVVATTAVAAVAANQKGTAVVKDPKDPDKSHADEIRDFGGMTGAPISGEMLGFSKGGKIPEPKYEGNTGGKEPIISDPTAGAMVPGSGNKDTVPAMLTPGEIVMSKPAVEKYGADTLLGMNAAAGSTNIPKVVEGVQYANQGGMVSLTSNGGRPISNKRMEKGKTYNFNDLMPHSHNPKSVTYHDGIKMGPGRDYGVGKIPDYMPTGPNGDIPTPQSGKILRAGDVGNGYGKSVVVDGPLGPMGFHHLSRIGSGIKQGGTVNKGKIVGVQGATGGNYAEHLHLNASKAGHEGFVNFITSGKPTTGGGSVPKEETADFWALAAIMSVESGNAQGRADVAQSIMNRAAAGGVYPGGPSLLGLITAPKQYEPVTRGDAKLWKAIKDKSTAIAALNSVPYVGGKGSQRIEEATKVLNDKTLMSNAAKFVGPRTDFSTPKAMQVHERYRDTHRDKEVERGGHVFGFFVGPGAVELGKKQFASGAGAAQANFGNNTSSGDLQSDGGGSDSSDGESKPFNMEALKKNLRDRGLYDNPPSRGTTMSSIMKAQIARSDSRRSSASDTGGNPASKLTPSGNGLPKIDANAMISQEKIKVLGLTVA